MRKTGSELFGERQKRIQDAIELRVPDRVPIWLGDFGYFTVKYVGLPVKRLCLKPTCSLQTFRPILISVPASPYLRPGVSSRQWAVQ